MLKIFFIIIFFFIEINSFAKDEYFLTLRYDKVNLRQGPSFEYPIKFIYKKKYLPIKIIDLAKKMAVLSGLRPVLNGVETLREGKISITVSGLRPGEKMFEELRLKSGDLRIQDIQTNLDTLCHKTIMSWHDMYFYGTAWIFMP